MNLRGVSGRFLVEPPLSTSTVALKIIFRSGLVEGGSFVKFKKKISFKPFFLEIQNLIVSGLYYYSTDN